jgi:WD40 repeat protein
VRLWRVADGALLRTIDAGNHIYAIAFSPDGRFIAGGGREKGAIGTLWKQIAPDRLHGSVEPTVKIWSLDGTLRLALAGHRDDASSVAISNDNQWLATASLDKTVKLWRLTR